MRQQDLADDFAAREQIQAPVQTFEIYGITLKAADGHSALQIDARIDPQIALRNATTHETSAN